MLWHKKGRKKENDMAKAGAGLKRTTLGLLTLGVFVAVIGVGWKLGQAGGDKAVDALEKRKKK